MNRDNEVYDFLRGIWRIGKCELVSTHKAIHPLMNRSAP